MTSRCLKSDRTERQQPPLWGCPGCPPHLAARPGRRSGRQWSKSWAPTLHRHPCPVWGSVKQLCWPQGLSVLRSLEQQAWRLSTAGVGLHVGSGWLQLAPAWEEEGSEGHRVSRLQTRRIQDPLTAPHTVGGACWSVVPNIRGKSAGRWKHTRTRSSPSFTSPCSSPAGPVTARVSSAPCLY